MKLSYKAPVRAVRVFVMLIWTKYMIDIGESVINDLRTIRDELSDKYGEPMDLVTEDVINEQIKCSGKVFLSGNEAYARVPTNVMVTICVYCQRHKIDKDNFESYLTDDMIANHHGDKVDLVVSQINSMNELISDTLEMYEDGIYYNDKRKD